MGNPAPNDPSSAVIAVMAKMRRALLELEGRHLPGQMSTLERDIYYGFVSECTGSPDKRVSSEDLRRTVFCKEASQASYNRALRKLVERGLIRHGEGLGQYYLGSPSKVAESGRSATYLPEASTPPTAPSGGFS